MPKASAWFWARGLIGLGLLLLAVGALPAVLAMTVLPGLDPLLPFLLSLTVAPVGALVLLVGLILALAAGLRRGEPGP